MKKAALVSAVVVLALLVVACGTVDPSPTPTLPPEQLETELLGKGAEVLGGLLGLGTRALNPGEIVSSIYWGFHNSLRWLELLIGGILFGLGFFGETFRPPQDLDKTWGLIIILLVVCLPYTALAYFGLIAAAMVLSKLNIQIG